MLQIPKTFSDKPKKNATIEIILNILQSKSNTTLTTGNIKASTYRNAQKHTINK